MTTVELERIASRVIAPGGAIDIVAVVDVEPCGHLSNGVPSGIVVEADGTKRQPRTRYGAAWFDGLRTSQAIHWFDRSSDQRAFIRILKGEPTTPRSGPQASHAGDAPPPAVLTTDRSEAQPEAPKALASSTPPAAAASVPPRPAAVPPAVVSEPGQCPECGGPMPPAGHGQRRLTCSDRCRTARARRLSDEARGNPAPGTTTAPVTASRAPGATSRPAGHFVAALTPGGPAERPADPDAGQTELGF